MVWTAKMYIFENDSKLLEQKISLFYKWNWKNFSMLRKYSIAKINKKYSLWTPTYALVIEFLNNETWLNRFDELLKTYLINWY